MSTNADRCVCGHIRYMHNLEGECCVSDHLLLICTCSGFREVAGEPAKCVCRCETCLNDQCGACRVNIFHAYSRQPFDPAIDDVVGVAVKHGRAVGVAVRRKPEERLPLSRAWDVDENGSTGCATCDGGGCGDCL